MYTRVVSKILPKNPNARPKNPLFLLYKSEKRILHVKPYKRVHFQFDPFHSQAGSIREFLYNLHTKQVRTTNPKCIFRTDILSNQEEPVVTFHLEDGKKLIFKTQNLTLIELMQLFNQYTKRFSPEEVEGAAPSTA